MIYAANNSGLLEHECVTPVFSEPGEKYLVSRLILATASSKSCKLL